ncbi:MAG: hypothetical protein IT320_07045, partial [Anaerolineae bacterium]|nr:hypothetical protein [Anaerolineae bacterium]
MLNEKIRSRGRAIIRELELGVDQTTEKWLAHYLAELMERAEKDATPELRKEAASESAAIILTLWEQKRKKARHEYYPALNNALNHVYEKRIFAEALKSVVDEPNYVDTIEEFGDQTGILFYLNIYEEDLLVLCLMTDIVSRTKKDDVPEKVDEDFELAVDMINSAMRHLQDIWPDIEQETSAQEEQLQSYLMTRLRIFHQLR